ncbi:FYVE, RhoGEF and PH domain-containing protein 5 [Erethizon dorsatum]
MPGLPEDNSQVTSEEPQSGTGGPGSMDQKVPAILLSPPGSEVPAAQTPSNAHRTQPPSPAPDLRSPLVSGNTAPTLSPFCLHRSRYPPGPLRQHRPAPGRPAAPRPASPPPGGSTRSGWGGARGRCWSGSDPGSRGSRLPRQEDERRSEAFPVTLLTVTPCAFQASRLLTRWPCIHAGRAIVDVRDCKGSDRDLYSRGLQGWSQGPKTKVIERCGGAGFTPWFSLADWDGSKVCTLDSPKPPVAPKPKTAAPKFPASPRAEGAHSPSPVCRGPKPPLAPKPRLAGPAGCRPGAHVNHRLSKCSNGQLPCGAGGSSNLECSGSETDEDIFMGPQAVPGEDAAKDTGSMGEEACVDGGIEDAGGPQDLTPPAGEGEEGPGDQEEEEDFSHGSGTGVLLPTGEEKEEPGGRLGLCDLEDGQHEALWNHENPHEEAELPGDTTEVEEDGEEPPFYEEPPTCEEPSEHEEPPEYEETPMCEEPPECEEPPMCEEPPECEETPMCEEPPEHEESLKCVESPGCEEPTTCAQEPMPAPEGLGVPQEQSKDIQADQDEPPEPDGTATQDGRGSGAGEDPVPTEPPEDSCQIIPFESSSVEDLVVALEGSPYELFPSESTSFCGISCAPVMPAGGLESEPHPMRGVPSTGTAGGKRAGAGEAPTGPDVVVLLEDEGATDVARSDPCVTGSEEDAACDTEGSLVPGDKRNVIPWAWPHSGKVAGCVPETVPEESGPEAPSLAVGIAKEAGRPALPLEAGWALHPRSFSVEGREPPGAANREPQGAGLDLHRMKRKEDNLSLPCVIGSSGSFSQSKRLPSSGTSTPCSLVDIPPPFDLACVTKRPVTKSFPSLLLDSEAPDRANKKKKSSFKRFLALTFRRKADSKAHVDPGLASSRSSSESSYHGPCRLLDGDRRSLGSSPQLRAQVGKPRAPESPVSLLFSRDGRRRGVPFSRTVSRVESFEDRSRPPFLPLPLTKPRSISFPNADTSDYENIPALSSDYENIQLPPRRPARPGTFTKLFEEQSRALSAANENDGYVDMSSFSAFDSRSQGTKPEAESAYTEPYKVCPVSATVPREDLGSEEEQGSSEEEDGTPRDPSITHKVEGPSRALVIAQELLSSERAFLQSVGPVCLDFHVAVTRALDNVEDTQVQEELQQGLDKLPAIHALHQGILQELEQRLGDGEGPSRVAGIFLAREQEFEHHSALILRFDRSLALLAQTCARCPHLAAAVRDFEVGPWGEQQGGQRVKQQLLAVVRRPFQYHALLTDYLNNLCPDSAEYDDTQGALTLISMVTDRAHDSMEQGENLQKLVHIEHSVRGQGDLLQPGREFLKEGTLMKVRGKDRYPRHLFLMSDVLLYTHPQKDGKYRLKRSLPVAGMKVSRPVMENVPCALHIETTQSYLTLSASSCTERDEWHSCLSRAVPEDHEAQALAAFHHSAELRERLGVSLGERPPTLVPVTHAMMCMNCGCDFSLTLRRHHCHACGKIVCRNCSRNKYPLKYLKDRMAKVCDGCFGELRKRGGTPPGPLRERPVTMSFPLSSPRFSSGSALSSVFHSINPSNFKKQKKVPSALAEVAASGEGLAISGYLSRCKRGKRPWKRLWFVIKGKVLYTYTAHEDRVAMESIPLLGFTILPGREEGSGDPGPVFHLYHKKTLFYSFKAEDTGTAQRWMEAMEDASVL